jgi:hypothetical protein
MCSEFASSRNDVVCWLEVAAPQLTTACNSCVLCIQTRPYMRACSLPANPIFPTIAHTIRLTWRVSNVFPASIADDPRLHLDCWRSVDTLTAGILFPLYWYSNFFFGSVKCTRKGENGNAALFPLGNVMRLPASQTA